MHKITNPTIVLLHPAQWLLSCSISTVYRAICSQTRKPVIIKAYQLQKMVEKNFLRLEREIRLMKLLIEDGSVVQLYNVFQEGNYKYLIMEMCKGGDLFKAMLLRGGQMEESWVCREVNLACVPCFLWR